MKSSEAKAEVIRLRKRVDELEEKVKEQLRNLKKLRLLLKINEE